MADKGSEEEPQLLDQAGVRTQLLLTVQSWRSSGVLMCHKV